MDLIILTITGIIVNIGCYIQLRGFRMTFLDSDDYMRLVRTKDFFDHWDWSNTVLARSNVPFGCDLHWSRFYDFFIVIPVCILNAFLDSINQSIEYVGFFISPVVKSVTIAILFSIFRKMMQKDEAFLATAIFAAHPLIIPFGTFGRPDHHAFIMLFLVIYLYNIMEIIELKFNNTKSFVKAAITATLCVWISPETIVLLLVTDGVLYLFSFFDSNKLKLLYFKNILTTIGICSIVFIPSSSGLHAAICLLLAIIPYSTFNVEHFRDWILNYWHAFVVALMMLLIPLIPSVEYDKISVVHLMLYFCSTLFFGINMVHSRAYSKDRIIISALWFIVIAVVFGTAYPGFFQGMTADIDDYVKKIWLNRISEMKSPFAQENALPFSLYSIVIIVSAVDKAIRLSRKKFAIADLSWYIFISNAVCYTALAGIHYRIIPYSIMCGLPIIVDFSMNSWITRTLSRLIKISLSIILSIFFFYVVALGENEKKSNEHSSYSQKELFELIDSLSSKPVVIMAHSNDGPLILYHTKHSVVGAPYHRQYQGIIATYKVMEDKYNEKAVRSILKITNSDYIFVRKHRSETKDNKSFAQMITDSKYPKWIVPINIPEKFNDIIIAKIDRSAL
ncbi:MAG: glycosyltransferase family 39 protein [Bacteroidales bacterium]|nr:glycosyltransferase family 39 protein [Bacteroidales bacterium]